MPSNNSFYSPDHPMSFPEKQIDQHPSQPSSAGGLRGEDGGDWGQVHLDKWHWWPVSDRGHCETCLSSMSEALGQSARFVMAAGRRQSWPLVSQTGLEMSSLGNFSFTYLHPTHNATKISGETNTAQPNQKISYPSTVRMTYPIQESSALWLNPLLVLYTFHAILFFV